ncbi:penicillin-binding transpeptidase domain-containing protein [Clostridium cellulovorans]|uniref:Penicillin-binding protein dimerization domain n=1 Tax=Clostridium cellulovorans (strain ATCC 35296 / DSM 3052 / OCM 3 / 743B) TaxID=573061 RepID=D9SS14_CLOC7|nr:penicillin-binding transpeptidase domain-containing protein [Clostridium cellulovorans]ADL52461.1 Penicillin-binding protein dimerization domain [Clostridium cellulovorans 743B]
MEKEKKRLRDKITRHMVLVFISILILLGVIARAFYLQVIAHDYYVEYANNKSHRVTEVSVARGDILDVNGNTLATSEQTYNLVYTDSKENQKTFNDTMIKVFKLLESQQSKNAAEPNKYNAKLDEDMPLKINPFVFEFNSVDEKGRKASEMRFKKDFGFNDRLAEENYNGLAYGKLKEEEQKEVDAMLETKTAEDTFNYLVDFYEVPAVYDLETQRKLVMIKNRIKIQAFLGNNVTVIASNLDRETQFLLQQKAVELPGISVEIRQKRIYPNNNTASSILGYMSKITDKKYEERGYNLSTDLIGGSGIESAFEKELRGTKGANVVEVNSSGVPLSTIATLEPVAGKTVKLTLDLEVQKKAEESLQKTMEFLREPKQVNELGSGNATRGATVAMNIKTGAVVSMASLPNFNPNDFATGNLSNEKYNEYYKSDYEAYGKANGWSQEKIDKIFPVNESGEREDFYDFLPKKMLNYATQSLQPTGSTFKVFTGYVGLHEGVITGSTTVNDLGVFEDDDDFSTEFKDEGSNGIVNLRKALQVSSNPFFMQTGQWLFKKYEDEAARNSLGIRSPLDVIAKYSWNLGLGADPNNPNGRPETGIEIPEVTGNVFNSTDLENSVYYSTLDTIMSALKNGVFNRINAKTKMITNSYTFQPIDLYYHTGNDGEATDSLELHNAKKAVKDYIRQIVLHGSEYNKPDEINKLLKEVIKNDPERYKNVTFKESTLDNYGDLDTISRSVIYDVARFDGYNAAHSIYNVYNASIGQGYTVATPLQLASSFATFWNDGTRLKAHLLDEIIDEDGNVVFKQEPEVISKFDMNKEYVDIIKEGTKDMIYKQESVAPYFKDLTYKGQQLMIGGKTGSATFREDQLKIDRNAFAWLMTYAPIEDPEIVVVTVIFDGHWGRVCSPVNAAVMDAYFKGKEAKEAQAAATATPVAK